MSTITDLDDYERRTAPATELLNSFATQLISELDEQNGAFPWWSSSSDWKTLTMIADYLIQSVGGVSEALASASLAAKTHREATHAENHSLTIAWRQLAKSGETNMHAFFAAMPRDRHARKRALVITSSAEHCFFHLGQTLDRLAAALVIVGGFDVNNVVTAHWGMIAGTFKNPGLLDELAGGSPARHIEPPGSDGARFQTDLLAPVAAADSYGEPGWLQWTRDTRNAMTHRSPAKKFNFLLGNVNTGLHLARLFYRQARWSELQSLVFGQQADTADPLIGPFIVRSSEDVLDGLCESMTRFVVALTEAMKACWVARQSDPSTIAQRASQWQYVAPLEPPSQFQGYGRDIGPELATVASPSGGGIAMSPLEGKRLHAGRAMDERRRDWTT